MSSMPATQATAARTNAESPAPARRPLRPGGWSESALRVLRERYLARDGKTLLETPEEMCWRVAACIARAEEKYGKTPEQVEAIALEFYDLMADSVFLPNSPTLMNAGKDNGLQYSACYVLPVGDSMEEIFESVKNAAIIHKCLVGETLVMTDRGLTRLSEVAGGAVVMTDEGPFSVSACHDNGEQPVFEVRTHRGFRVVGTAEHRLLVVGDDGLYQWRRIGELREGDWLILKPGSWIGGETKLPEFIFVQRPGRNATSFKATEYSLPRELTPELAELIGLYIGDGSNHRDGIRFTVGTGSPEIVERIKDLSDKLFGKKVTTSLYRGKRAVEVSILSTQIRQWFEFIGVTKASSREAHVPQIILRSTEEVASAFVRGLFSADGCIRENGHITLTTTSEKLAEELQVMMLALGIPTHLRRDVSEAGYRSYQLSVCTKAGFLAFREKVGFLDRKKQERLAAVDDDGIFVKGETIPNQRGRLRDWYDALPRGTRVQARPFFDDLLNRVKDPRELSRQRVTAVMERASLVPPFFGGLAAENLFFSRVTAVGYVGTRRVYDLTVPQKHAYLANGFVSHNSGGGTGFAFSRLRPKDAVVRSTGGKASGPVSFLRVFNGATEAVKQGGTRRGANMGILRVDHPDILEFIESKLDGGITNFNISVAVTERFMEALKADGEYDLAEPHTARVTGRLRAREVFERIVQAAWKTGDPGLFFVDRCNAGPANPTPTLDKVEATNPCLAGETLVATDRGLVRMAELAAAFAQGGIAVQVDPRLMPSRFLVFEGTHNVPVSAYDGGCLPISRAFCSGERETVRVRTKSGLELVCTPDHRIMTARGWVQAGELRVGTDRILVQSSPGAFGSDPRLPFEVPNEVRGRNGRLYRHALPTEWSRELGLALGFLVGDGWLRSGDKNCRVGFTFGAGNRALLAALKGTLDGWYGRPVRVVRRANGVDHLSYHGKFFVDFFERLGARPVEAAAKVVPETLFRAPREAVVGFLQGLFTADGTVRENPQSNSAWIALTSKSRELLRGVQLLLLHLGIRSQILERSRPPRAGVFPYRTRGGAQRSYTADGVLFELGIFGESRDRFRREIGFLNARQGRLEAVRYRRFYRQKWTDVVAAVEPNGVQKVYDLTEPNSHTVIASGLVAHQCGEQPLYPNEACFAPETRITTDRGLEAAADLYARYQRGESVLVATNLNGQGRQIVFRPAVVVKVGVKATVRVTLSNGQQIRVTPDHRILTQEGWKEAGALSREDRVCVQTGMAGPLAITSTDGDLQRMLGWFTGDGWFTNAVGLTFGPEDELAFQRLLPVWRQFTGSATRVQTQSTLVRCIATERAEAIAAFKAYGFAPGRGPEKRAPKFVFTAPKEEQIRYLQGLFGADGSKTHRKSQVTLSSASLELLRDVQLLLLNLGMRSNIKYYPHRPTGRAWGQLKVNGQSYHRFLDLIGFPLTPQKQERCDQFAWHWTKQDRLAVGVASVIADEEVEVYDVSEPVTHSLIAEGMIVHNCNLGSLNLAKFVKLGDTAEGIDWAEIERAVRASVRFLDDVIEVNPYPLAEINEAVKKNRRIGLGVMGWADMLCCLGIPYDSEAALELGDRVMAFIQEKGHDESRRLAAERGPFPTWPQSIYREKGMRRNSTVTTIAPTGTISIIADCSSGIEPLFAVAFEHRVGERRLSFVNKHFEAVAKARGFASDALMQKVTERGTLHGLTEVPEDVRRVFVTAHEVAPEWHVRHQAAFQRHTENGVSKTINLPNSATPEDVRSAYLLAYETGCIGITVFRDGCKGTQVLHVGTGAKEKEQVKEPAAAPAAPVQPRPRVVQGVTYRTETPLGTAYITVNQSPQGEPLEVFANVGKVGSETAAVSEAIGRLVSLCLRLASPVPPKERVKQIVEQLGGIGGSRHLGFGKERVRSLPDAIAKVLAEHVGMIEAEEQSAAQLTLPERTGPPIKVGDPCPDCGEATLAYEEGCLKCYGCGFAEC